MVTRYAVVCDGTVENVVMWDGDTDTWQPAEGCEMVPLNGQTVSPGDLYNGGTFAPGAAASVATVPVEVDPAALVTLLDQAQKATTVASTRSVLTSLIEHLTPSE